MRKKKNTKKFVLDTNILLQYPDAMLNGFDDNDVVITGTVLQELDKKKTVGGDVGFYARKTARILDDIRNKGDILKGIPLENGGHLMFEPNGVDQKYLPAGFNIEVPDNRIISSCKSLQEKNPDQEVILVSNDIYMRLNATACQVKVQEYFNSVIEDSGYKGYIDIDVDSELITDLYQSRKIEFPLSDHPDLQLLENEFVTLHCGSQSALSVWRRGHLELIQERKLCGWITPRNALQTYAMWALTQPAEDLPLVILIGPAGSSKTFLALAAGLDATYTSQRRSDAQYYSMLLSRPVGNSFDEIGYLPGDLDEKLHFLYQNFYDNLAIILKGNGKDGEEHAQIQQQIDDLFDSGVMEVCGLNFIRGRSLMNSYMICDEAQNASGGAGTGAIRDVITRVGMGTKLVIAGDPTQIDVPTLDKRNNGLIYAAEAMKGDPTTAIIVFGEGESVRSTLARNAIRRMKR